MNEPINIPLDQFQRWMLQLLLDPFQQTGVNPSELLPKGFERASLEDIVNHSEKLPAREHLAIYQRSYIARLRSCMAQQFSALAFALGEEIFCAFADDYLATHPSNNYNLAHLGKHFSAYLESNRPDAQANKKEDWIDFIIELANFEYEIGILFEKKGEEDYPLAEIHDDESKLKLIPIVGLFNFRFPVRWFYSEFKNGNAPALPFEKESYCVVLRHNFKLAVYDLHRAQYEFLSALSNGLDVNAAKSEFKKNHPEQAEEFERLWPEWKKRWVEVNMFRI